ncbi:MAG: hypothetical protein VX699_02970 [Myxococcota bacterium]|nr:hypothetical protein [Myxococcota bacterium]
MSKRSLKTLMKVRALVERQAEMELAQINQRILQGRNALEQFQYQAATAQVEGEFSLAIVDLSERAALSTAFALEEMKEVKDARQKEYEERVLQRKQAERLVERLNKRESAQERRREQAALDDWTASNWSRR